MTLAGLRAGWACQGRSSLRPRRARRYRGLGKRVVALAREAKEQIVETGQETGTNR